MSDLSDLNLSEALQEHLVKAGLGTVEIVSDWLASDPPAKVDGIGDATVEKIREALSALSPDDSPPENVPEHPPVPGATKEERRERRFDGIEIKDRRFFVRLDGHGEAVIPSRRQAGKEQFAATEADAIALFNEEFGVIATSRQYKADLLEPDEKPAEAPAAV